MNFLSNHITEIIIGLFVSVALAIIINLLLNRLGDIGLVIATLLLFAVLVGVYRLKE